MLVSTLGQAKNSRPIDPIAERASATQTGGNEGWGVVRSVVPVLAVSLLLGACAARDPYVSASAATAVGNWRVERQTDRITGAPLSSAILRTTNSSQSAVAFTRPAALQIGCFKDQPVVRMAFEFKVGSNRNSVLGYRFDEKPGHEIEARFLQDFKTVVIEERQEVVQFVTELATSNLLYIRIRSLNAGRTAAEFRVDGAPAAIEAALAQCPVTAEPEHKRKSS